MTEDTRQTLAHLLDANEPEALVAAVGLMCERKTHDRFLGETERERWNAAARALAGIIIALEEKNAPSTDDWLDERQAARAEKRAVDRERAGTGREPDDTDPEAA